MTTTPVSVTGSKSNVRNATITVFLIDRQPILRQGIASVIEVDADFHVAGQANNVQEATPKLEELKPDVVIIDAFCPGCEGVEAIDKLRETCPEAQVLILTDSKKEIDYLNAIRAGAKGYLSKNLGTKELIDSIRLVAGGEAVVYSLMGISIFGGQHPRDKNAFMGLSEREKEILALVARGRTNKEIAAVTYVSETTVKSHLRRIREKLNVKNRAQAVAMAAEQGWLGDQSESE